MAARYVNPTNVVAQGLDFYTGLPDAKQQQAGSGPGLAEGSYTSGGGGGGGRNVMGRGSGGSAGVGADRTGSDSSKTWNYAPQMSIKMDIADKREDSVKPDPTADPRGGTSNPTPSPTPTPATGRPRQPQGGPPPRGEIIEGELVDDPAFPQLGRGFTDAPSWETPDAPQLTGGASRALGRGSKPMGELSGPVKPIQSPLALPQYSEPTRAGMDARNTRDRKRRASMIPASHLRFAAEEITKTIPGHVQPAASRNQGR